MNHIERDTIPILRKQQKEVEKRNISLANWIQSFPASLEEYRSRDFDERMNTAVRLFWSYACKRSYTKDPSEVAVIVDHEIKDTDCTVISSLYIFEGDHWRGHPDCLHISTKVVDRVTGSQSSAERIGTINVYSDSNNEFYTLKIEYHDRIRNRTEIEPLLPGTIYRDTPTDFIINIIDRSSEELLKTHIFPRHELFASLGERALIENG